MRVFFDVIKKDERNKEDIYNLSKSKVGLMSFSPLVGTDENGKEERCAGDVAKLAVPIDVIFKEVSLNA